MITVIKKEITVIRRNSSGVLLLNHRNHFINNKTKGQSIAEYTILITVVSVALLAMQIYMKRGIQAAVKYNADQFGNQEYLDRDPEKGYLVDSALSTLTDSATRIKQDKTSSGYDITTTFDENTTSTGMTHYWHEELTE